MLEADFDRNSQPLAEHDYGMRNGPVDDISSMSEHEALTPGPARPDVDGVIRQRSAAQHYRWLADRTGAMVKEMRIITERPSEYYAAQKALLEAADYLRDAAKRMEGNHE